VVPQEYYTIHFPQLVVFQSDNSDYSTPTQDICYDSEGFFGLNPTIQDIIVHPKHFLIGSRFEDAIYASLLNPRRPIIEEEGEE
jgi:hypothetical protein